MQFKFTTLLSVVAFLMFLVIGCENPSEPISKQDRLMTASNTTSLAKGKGNGKNDENEKNNDKNDDHDNDHHEGDDNNNCNNSGGGSGTCDADGIVPLWAGKTINVGTVTVTQDQNKLYVKYSTTGSWKISETHLDVSTSAYTQRGAPGQYDYQSSNGGGVTTYTYTVPITWAAGTKIYFLAHAVVGKYSNSEELLFHQRTVHGSQRSAQQLQLPLLPRRRSIRSTVSHLLMRTRMVFRMSVKPVLQMWLSD
jgi:hypothetical protein